MIEGLAGANSRTPAGGFADLRNAYAADNSAGAFDEFAHTADLRRGAQSAGWHNISHLGVFIWWLQSFPIRRRRRSATARPRRASPSTQPAGQFRCSPSSRTGARPSFGEDWISPEEWELPVAVRETLWRSYPDQLYPRSFAVDLGGGTTPAPLPRTDVRIHPESGVFSFVGTPPRARQWSPTISVSCRRSAPAVSRSAFETIDQPATVTTVSGGTGLDAALAVSTGSGTSRSPTR